jgi:alkanesulfonate monooxygenase SsuD/methylene tetrahydromethanopterin reductase-like flavin-dependent oxidoreductase (luciferase family)
MAPTSTRPLKVGLLLPTGELAEGRSVRWDNLRAMALHAEAVGFDSLWVPDHLLFGVGELLSAPSEPRRGLWECWSVLASLAAVTTHVELGTAVACTNFRNPALLAKMADTIDEISGGRLILGLGGGWHETEFQAFRFEEALQIIHTLLRKGAIDFHGQYYQLQGCELRPRGPRLSGPPILIGARQSRMLRLVAQYGDYWNAYSINQVENISPAKEAVDAACAAAARDPTTLKRSIEMLIDLPGSEGAPSWVRHFRSLVAPPATGTPQELANLLRTFAREGISHVQLWLEPATMAGIDAFAPVLELLDRG